MNRQAIVFLEFLRRDFHVHLKQIPQFLINFTFIYPLSFAFSFAYLQAHIYFTHGANQIGTSIFAGNFLLILLLCTYKLIIPLLFDLEGDRYINYQALLLNPRLILIERIVFTTLLSFFVLIPFFPVTKLFLGQYLFTTNTSWIQLMLVLFIAALFLSSYNLLLACFIKKMSQLSLVWKRFNLPLLFFGGFLMPWYIMNSYSPIVGFITLINPFIYVSEAIRQSLLGSPQFFSLGVCIAGMLFFTCVMTLLAFYYFKKRTDYL